MPKLTKAETTMLAYIKEHGLAYAISTYELSSDSDFENS